MCTMDSIFVSVCVMVVLSFHEILITTDSYFSLHSKAQSLQAAHPGPANTTHTIHGLDLDFNTCTDILE